MEKKLVPLLAMFVAGFVVAILLRQGPGSETPAIKPPSLPVAMSEPASSESGEFEALKVRYAALLKSNEDLKREVMRRASGEAEKIAPREPTPESPSVLRTTKVSKSDREFYAETAEANERFVPNMPYRAYRPYRAFKVYAKGDEKTGSKNDCQNHRHAAECWGTYVHCERDPDNPECEGTSFYCQRFPESKTCIGTEQFCIKNQHSRNCVGTHAWCLVNRRDAACGGSSDACRDQPDGAPCFGTKQFCEVIGGPPCP